MCFNWSNSPYALRDEIWEIKRRKRQFCCIVDRVTTLIAGTVTSGIQMPEENCLMLYENCITVEIH